MFYMECTIVISLVLLSFSIISIIKDNCFSKNIRMFCKVTLPTNVLIILTSFLCEPSFPQIRKQQKEHAELIEEYRVKHQQNNMTPIMPGMHPMPGHGSMGPSGQPMVQPPMNPMMQMPVHPGQVNAPPRMPNPPPGWHPNAPMSMGGPAMPPMMPQQVPMGNPGQHHQMSMGNMPQHPQMPMDPQAAQIPTGGVKPMQPGGVKFDDNNPFSEGFQERERRERLREQQERQRVQLMQEVERQRALKHRMEMEQQGMMGPDGNMAPLTQMPFYNTELPQDFMQPQRPPLQQQPLGPVYPQQQGTQPPGAFMPGDRRALMGNGMMPPEMGPGFGPDHLANQAPKFPQGHPRPRQFSGPGPMLQMPGEGLPVDAATHLPSNFPGSGQSLIQLYSNIIPDEKGKKKRSRKKKKDDDTDSVKTPSTPHSDLTAPLTPCVSDTSSTPTRNTHLFGEQDLSRSPLLGSSTPSHSELERQLSGGQAGLSSESARAQEHDQIINNIKLEQTEASECHGPVSSELGSIKEEGGKGSTSPFPAGQSPKGEAGNELLKHLLKNKSTPPPLPQQRSEESLRLEEEESTDCKSLLRQSSIDSNGVSLCFRNRQELSLPVDHKFVLHSFPINYNFFSNYLFVWPRQLCESTFLISRLSQTVSQTSLGLCFLNRRKRKGGTRGCRREERSLFPDTKRGRRKEMKGNCCTLALML